MSEKNIFDNENTGVPAYGLVDGFDIRTNAERERDAAFAAIEELTEAIRFTVEYIGMIALPPIEGWSWYDAMVKHAPDKAEELKRSYQRYVGHLERRG